MSSEARAAAARIAAAHDAAFRAATGKWRGRRHLVRTPTGGTFFPSDVAVFATLLPRIGLEGRVLEVGSGDGRLLSLLALLRRRELPGLREVVGVEVVPEYLEASRIARSSLGGEIDFDGVTERRANVLEVDVHPFDAVLYFAGGAMPWQEEEAFREALRRELRPAAALVAWGPDAEGFDLPPRSRHPVPGYHTVHVYGGRGGSRPAGAGPEAVVRRRLGYLLERAARRDRGRALAALNGCCARLFPGARWAIVPGSGGDVLRIRLPDGSAREVRAQAR